MIANQTKGKNFGGALKYLLSKQDARIIGGNMLGENIQELTTEFQKSRDLRPNLQKCVWHASLSLPHNESLSNEKWSELGTQYAHKMGFDSSQFVIVRHYDTKHEHIHIVASRVTLEGQVVSDSNDYRRSEKIVRGLENSYSLSPTISSREVGRKAMTKGELHQAIREQKPSVKMLLQQEIDVAKRDQPSVTTFIERLERQNIWVIPNMAKNGTVTGISFCFDGEIMKGSDLGRKYSWNNLIKNGGIGYEQNRDYARLAQAKAKSRDLYSERHGEGHGQGSFRLYRKLRQKLRAIAKKNRHKVRKGGRGSQYTEEAARRADSLSESHSLFARGLISLHQLANLLLEISDDNERDWRLDLLSSRDQNLFRELTQARKQNERKRMQELKRSKSLGLGH